MIDKRTSISLLILLIAILSAGCGALKNDYDKHNEVEEPEFYQPGKAVAGGEYGDTQEIMLYLINENSEQGTSGSYEKKKLENGSYVEEGVHNIGISVSDARDGQRVFIGDGGRDYQVEAEFDESRGLYTCNFEFFDSNTYVTHPVLIQVIYEDGSASKKKLVVTTIEGLRPAFGNLVENGLNISISANILDKIKGAAAEDATSLKPIESDGQGIMRMDAGGVTVDMVITDTCENEEGVMMRGVCLGAENIQGGTPNNILEFFIGIFLKILPPLSTPPVYSPPNAISIQELLAAGSTESAEGGTSAGDDPMAALLENLQLNSLLFPNIKGFPEETDGEFAVLKAGIYTIDSSEAEFDENGDNLWPAVVVDDKDTMIDIDRIKVTGETDIGVAFSQYNLNQMLKDLMRSFQLVLEDVQELLPVENSMNAVMTINPDGIAINMKNLIDNVGSMAINDIRLTLYENNEPMADLSLDLNMDAVMNLNIQDGEYVITLVMTPDFERSHCHVMKDKLGLGSLLDHSNLIQVVLPDGLPIPIPTGLKAPDGLDLKEIEFDEHGNCFMNLALDDLDTSAFCFISSANHKSASFFHDFLN